MAFIIHIHTSLFDLDGFSMNDFHMQFCKYYILINKPHLSNIDILNELITSRHSIIDSLAARVHLMYYLCQLSLLSNNS